jgi:hypothetical protein
VRGALRWPAWIVLALVAVFGTLGAIRAIGARRYCDEVGRIHASGSSLEERDFLPPEIPEEENAATLYERAFASLTRERPAEGGVSASDGIVGGSTDAAAVAALRGWLAENEAALALAHEAAARPRYGFSADRLDAVPWQDVRNLTLLLAGEARLALLDGDSPRAFRAGAAALHVANSLGEEPLVIARLVCYACQQTALSPLEAALASGRPDPEAAAAIKAEIDRFERAPLKRVFEGERAYVAAILRGWRNGSDARGANSFVRGRAGGFLYRELLLDYDAAALLRAMSDMVDAVDRPVAEWPASFSARPAPWYAIAARGLDVLPQIPARELAARQRLAALRTALEAPPPGR